MALRVGLIVPVYKNFEGFTRLMGTVDHTVVPLIHPNYIHNEGVSVAWNSQLERAADMRCDVALVVNDDVTFTFEGTIHKLVTAIRDKGFDLVSGINVRDTEPEDLYGHSYPTDQEPDFSCFAVQPESFLDKFGRFDEAFSPAYFEDNDMAYRLKLAGAKVARLRYAPHYHAGSVTQNWNGKQVVTGPMFRANEAYYIGKWGGKPGHETHTTPFGA
jgi:GT2 family glycosyltransferase